MFVHELGHFIFAKRAGMFVREFSLGLGPKLFSFKKGETQYSLRIIPFGAYVRVAGEDPEVVEIKTGQTIYLKTNHSGIVTDIYLHDTGVKTVKLKVDSIDLEHKLIITGEDEEQRGQTFKVAENTMLHYDKQTVQIAPWSRQFGSKSILSRFKMVFGGPLFNIIATIILFFIIAMMVGVPSDVVSLGPINEGSPAELAGLQQGDIVVTANEIPIKTTTDLITIIQKNPDKELNLSISRDGEPLKINVTPAKDEQGIGKIGAVVSTLEQDASIFQAGSFALKNTAEMSKAIIDGFVMLFSGSVGMNDLAGPVGIMKITGDAAKQGIPSLLNWAAILSLYLGIFNLLPVPALDGSRLLFITIEALRGKPVDPRKESMVHLIGFAFLMLLMIVVTVNDISKIFQ